MLIFLIYLLEIYYSLLVLLHSSIYFITPTKLYILLVADAIIMIIFTICSCSVAVLKNIWDTLFLGEIKKNVSGMCEITAAGMCQDHYKSILNSVKITLNKNM